MIHFCQDDAPSPGRRPGPQAPRAGSLRAKLLAYFQANPDEELTRADIVTKFGLSANSLDKVLQRMKEKGEIERASVWRAPRG